MSVLIYTRLHMRIRVKCVPCLMKDSGTMLTALKYKSTIGSIPKYFADVLFKSTLHFKNTYLEPIHYQSAHVFYVFLTVS